MKQPAKSYEKNTLSVFGPFFLNTSPWKKNKSFWFQHQNQLTQNTTTTAKPPSGTEKNHTKKHIPRQKSLPRTPRVRTGLAKATWGKVPCQVSWDSCV